LQETTNNSLKKHQDIAEKKTGKEEKGKGEGKGGKVPFPGGWQSKSLEKKCQKKKKKKTI